MSKDQITLKTAKKHKTVNYNRYTFDYKHMIFTGPKQALLDFIDDLKSEFITPVIAPMFNGDHYFIWV